MKIQLVSPEKLLLNAYSAPSITLVAGVEHEFSSQAEYKPYRHHVKALVNMGQMKITRHEFVKMEAISAAVMPKEEAPLAAGEEVVSKKNNNKKDKEKSAE